MEEQQIGWIAALIIGGIVGWVAEQFLDQFTNIQIGLVMNTVLGIAGAAVASWLLSFLGVSLGGWIGYLIAGFIGACVLIAIARALTGGLQQPKKF
jgi:uncharacterized membrane protein YeaQ/YmgE (transglycosylase-associated protein family)